jgi:hypothetical protein
MRSVPILTLVVLTAGLGLTACEKTIEAPADREVCFAMQTAPNGTVKFNPLARNQKDLEHCAAQLDIMRLQFMGLGSSANRVVGAYQTQFLFVGPEGVYTAQTFKGQRYLLMVHSGDGELVKPGAMPPGS